MATRNSSGHLLNERVQIHPDGSKEYWRDIPGYEGLYRVSSWGRIKVLQRVRIKRTRWGGIVKQIYKSRIMKPVLQKTGRYCVGLVRHSGEPQKLLLVYRLVLLAFVGPCPKGMECCHFPDRDPTNDRLENLRWDTRVSNSTDRVIHGTSPTGENNGFSKLTNEDVLLIRKLYKQGWTIMNLSRRFCLNRNTISGVVRRKSWKHI